MGCINLNKCRKYWCSKSNLTDITECMSRDPFEEIKSCLQFADNTLRPIKDSPNHDKIYKIRPFYQLYR